jgi:PadR family transcriptional regulator, regulatory protein AphA
MKKTPPETVSAEFPQSQPSLSPGDARQSREKASRFAVLGMLTLARKLSGYDIKKAIANSTANFWSESYGNIYPVLKKLLAQGAIRTEIDDAPAGNRQKQLYSVTPTGRQLLEDWLRQPAAPAPEDNELLLKLFFSAGLPPQEPLAHVKAHREYHTALLRKFTGIEGYIAAGPGTEGQKTYWLATLRYGKAVSRALLEWCDETEAELHKLNP